MTFKVVADGSYLAVLLDSGRYLLPRWFCREVGLTPGSWKVEPGCGVILRPRPGLAGGKVVDAFVDGRRLRAFCEGRFCEVTGISVPEDGSEFRLVREDA